MRSPETEFGVPSAYRIHSTSWIPRGSNNISFASSSTGRPDVLPQDSGEKSGQTTVVDVGSAGRARDPLLQDIAALVGRIDHSAFAVGWITVGKIFVPRQARRHREKVPEIDAILFRSPKVGMLGKVRKDGLVQVFDPASIKCDANEQRSDAFRDRAKVVLQSGMIGHTSEGRSPSLVLTCKVVFVDQLAVANNQRRVDIDVSPAFKLRRKTLKQDSIHTFVFRARNHPAVILSMCVTCFFQGGPHQSRLSMTVVSACLFSGRVCKGTAAG